MLGSAYLLLVKAIIGLDEVVSSDGSLEWAGQAFLVGLQGGQIRRMGTRQLEDGGMRRSKICG